MSLLKLDLLKKKEVIFQYILDVRHAGITLPYLEYAYIEEWLKAAGDDDEMVLLVLTGILPKFYEKGTKSAKPLKLVHEKILKQIQALRNQVLSGMSKNRSIFLS